MTETVYLDKAIAEAMVDDEISTTPDGAFVVVDEQFHVDIDNHGSYECLLIIRRVEDGKLFGAEFLNPVHPDFYFDEHFYEDNVEFKALEKAVKMVEEITYTFAE